MSFNLFYDLPGDIRHIIHKKIFSLEVLEELKNRPGNFSFMEQNVDFFTGISWSHQLEKDYRSIEKLGPRAWSFLRTCEDFFGCFKKYSKSTPLIFYEIYYTLYDNHVDMITFRASVSNMQMISRMGWDKYKILYTRSHN